MSVAAVVDSGVGVARRILDVYIIQRARLFAVRQEKVPRSSPVVEVAFGIMYLHSWPQANDSHPLSSPGGVCALTPTLWGALATQDQINTISSARRHG